MKEARWFIVFCIIFSSPIALAATPTLSANPESVIQGEPILLTFDGVAGTSSIKSISFDTTPLKTFLFQNKVYALIGIDLHKKPGTYTVSAELVDGTKLSKQITVGERPVVSAPLGIPEKLGGNTPQSQATLVSTLATENASLENIRTGLKAFWSAPFLWPLSNITVTDLYGYSRQTGGYTIAHKGTDFRAAEGTPVMAINRGVVRVAKTYRNYGKTIVVDHGLGLMSFYMHLSKINVGVGELVLPGEVIGLSGQTGYAEAPHLHLTVRLNGTSIDPMKFFELVKQI